MKLALFTFAATILTVQQSALAWHNPWDVLPHAYPSNDQCKIPRGASARTKFYSYDLNPEWGTGDFLGPAAMSHFQVNGGSRGGSDWNRFCGDMYSSYEGGEGRGGAGSICGKPWKLWWAKNVSKTRAEFWALDFERNPVDEKYFKNWDTPSYWKAQGVDSNDGKMRLRGPSLNCKNIGGYNYQSKYLGPMASQAQTFWSVPPGFRRETQSDLLMTLVSCVQPCMENDASTCCTVPIAIAPLFPCCAAAGCCAHKGLKLNGRPMNGRRRAFSVPNVTSGGHVYNKTSHPTVAINVQAGAASKVIFNRLLDAIRTGATLAQVMTVLEKH